MRKKGMKAKRATKVRIEDLEENNVGLKQNMDALGESSQDCQDVVNNF
jgi:hypothetical protein